MTNKTKFLANKAISLPPEEKLSLIDSLLSSLDQPDPKIDELWKKEAESRLKAYKSGKIKTISLQYALAKYRRAKAA